MLTPDYRLLTPGLFLQCVEDEDDVLRPGGGRRAQLGGAMGEDRLCDERILKRQVGEEEKHGDVYELPIDCRDWEATLDSLTHFLFDLQAENAMLDVRQLLIRPNKDASKLRGRFLLNCAYTRGPGTEEK